MWRQEELTPLDTAWQRCCIQSAMSASLSALSSRQGRSARMTWKAWGRSVALDLRQPPHCSPLGQRMRGETGAQRQGWLWRGNMGLPLEGRPDPCSSRERLKAAGQPLPFCVIPFTYRITKILSGP